MYHGTVGSYAPTRFGSTSRCQSSLRIRRYRPADSTEEADMRIVMLLAALAVAVGAGSAYAGSSAPQFTARIDNAWFPLLPGSVYTYRGTKDGEPSREVMTVTHRTVTIDGAPCVVVD